VASRTRSVDESPQKRAADKDLALISRRALPCFRQIALAKHVSRDFWRIDGLRLFAVLAYDRLGAPKRHIVRLLMRILFCKDVSESYTSRSSPSTEQNRIEYKLV